MRVSDVTVIKSERLLMREHPAVTAQDPSGSDQNPETHPELIQCWATLTLHWVGGGASRMIRQNLNQNLVTVFLDVQGKIN